MNESDTRLKKIDPALRNAGWGLVEGSDIFTEQRAYLLTPGRIVTKAKRNPDIIDYLLTYKGVKFGIIEAKKDELDVSAGVEQAKKYAAAMNIRYTYFTNGDKIWAIDMDAKPGDFTEGFVDRFPTPIEREQRVAIARSEIIAELNSNQTEFVNFVLDQYMQHKASIN